MRMLSVLGAALALAMCLAFPAAAAPPNDHLSFDVMAYEPAVAPAFDAVAAMPVTEPDLFVLASTSAADKADAYCDGLGDSGLTRCLDLLFGVTSRHYDPGWRAS